MSNTEYTNMQIVSAIESIFIQSGDCEYLGEPVTMSEHMLQCALLAEENSDSNELVVAALLHDIGHFTSELGSFAMDDLVDKLHEEAGAQWLAPFFPSVIVDCVRFHVPAKRYLCKTEPEYFAGLSEASVHSLQLQGGPMSDNEVREFEQNPNLDAIVKVRRYDDLAKVAGKETPSLEHYMVKVRQVANDHAENVS